MPEPPPEPVPETRVPPDPVAGPVAPTKLAANHPPEPSTVSPALTVPGYDLLEMLGQGGMGVVWKARQRSLNRLVALKMIRAGLLATAEERGRFQAEAETVARLQHPNIVQILDVGEYAGQAYLSLEFLAGGSLAARLAGTPLAPAAAARLTADLARAMHAVHQRGVIHRDLKPGNVLLAGDPDTPLEQCTPKVGDFGLARRLDDDSNQTHTGAVMGSPSYMAPEQALGRGKQAGPAADVYGLGAILYELLTGRPPFKAATALETLDQVKRLDPVPPRHLQPRLPRDLETICLKCLRKEPRQRYATALELAEDLDRFRCGEPIKARPVSAPERTLKWTRRHPTAAALLAVSVLAAVLGLGGGLAYHWRVTAERGRAQAHLRRAVQAVEQMLTQVGQDRLVNVPNSEALRKRLVLDAQRFLDELLREEPDDLEVRRAAARTYRQVGNLYRQLGDLESARAAFDRARELATGTTAADQEERAGAYHGAALVHRDAGRVPAGVEAADESIALWQALADADPATPRYRFGLARALLARGWLHKDAGDWGPAEEDYGQCRRTLSELHGQDPAQADYRQELARANHFLGWLFADQGQHERAAKYYTEAVRERERLVADFPGVVAYREDLGYSLNNLANTRSQLRQFAAADRAYRHGTEIFQSLAGDFPAVPEYRSMVGLLQSNRVDCHLKQDRSPDEVRPLLEQALANHQAALAASPRNREFRFRLSLAYRNLAEVERRLGRHQEAERAAKQAAELE